MLKKLLRIDECKLVGVYMLATVVLYGGFWLSYYNIENYITALLIAPAYVGVGLLLLLIGKAVKDGKKDYEFEESRNFRSFH